jgi:hypothetical protein
MVGCFGNFVSAIVCVFPSHHIQYSFLLSSIEYIETNAYIPKFKIVFILIDPQPVTDVIDFV